MGKIKTNKIIAAFIAFVLNAGIILGNIYDFKASAASNEQTIYNFLINEMGFNSAAACGVLANIEKESNFRNDLLEGGYTWNSGGGYGICQWTNTPRTSSTGRRTNLVNWCGNNGYNYKSLTGQLYFLKHELETTYKNSVYTPLKGVSNNADGAYNAGYKWCYSFEVPAGYNTGVSVTRGNLAKSKYWPKYGGEVIKLEVDTYYSNYMPLTAYINSANSITSYGSDCVSSIGRIDPGDKCTVIEVYTNGYCKVEYPTPSSPKIGYVPVTAFFCCNNKAISPRTAPKNMTAYSRKDMSANIGSIDKGDACYVVGTDGNALQAIYPTPSGKKLGWSAASEWNYVTVIPDDKFNPYCPIKSYILSASENKNTYESDHSSKAGSIYTTDLCTVLEVYSDGWCYVSYPVTGGTKEKYIQLKEFVQDTGFTHSRYTADKKINVYTRSDMVSSPNWWVSAGDIFFVISTKGNLAQVMYPIDEQYGGGYKLGWIYSGDIPAPAPETTAATTKATTAATTKATTAATTKATTKATTAAITKTTTKATTAATTKAATKATTPAVTNTGDNIIYGDVNGDGLLNVKDIVILRQYLVGDWKEGISAKNADMNKDGKINLKDVFLIRKAIVGDYDTDYIDPDSSVNYSTFSYGQSEKGRSLVCHSISPEKYDRTILLNFEIHGFEDNYDADGQVLVDTANYLIDYYKKSKNLSCRLLIIPSANPDGLLDGNTKNGFGRCNANSVDLNRDFDANYSPETTVGRNFTPFAFSASESRALRDLVKKYEPSIVLDFHGWLNCTIGDSELAEVFYSEMGLSHQVGFTATNAKGYFANWAHQQGSLGLLVEFRDTQINRDNLVKAVDRLINEDYDNGKGKYAPDPGFAEFKDINGYTLTTGRTDTYQFFDTPFSGASYIDGSTDLCTIHKIYANGWVKAEYPVSSGTKIAYCHLSDFIDPAAAVKHYKANVSANTDVYRRSDKAEKAGSVWTTDTFTVVAQKSSMLQIIYPLDNGGWKLGWIDKGNVK